MIGPFNLHYANVEFRSGTLKVYTCIMRILYLRSVWLERHNTNDQKQV